MIQTFHVFRDARHVLSGPWGSEIIQEMFCAFMSSFHLAHLGICSFMTGLHTGSDMVWNDSGSASQRSGFAAVNSMAFKHAREIHFLGNRIGS